MNIASIYQQRLQAEASAMSGTTNLTRPTRHLQQPTLNSQNLRQQQVTAPIKVMVIWLKGTKSTTTYWRRHQRIRHLINTTPSRAIVEHTKTKPIQWIQPSRATWMVKIHHFNLANSAGIDSADVVSQQSLQYELHDAYNITKTWSNYKPRPH